MVALQCGYAARVPDHFRSPGSVVAAGTAVLGDPLLGSANDVEMKKGAGRRGRCERVRVATTRAFYWLRAGIGNAPAESPDDTERIP